MEAHAFEQSLNGSVRRNMARVSVTMPEGEGGVIEKEYIFLRKFRILGTRGYSDVRMNTKKTITIAGYRHPVVFWITDTTIPKNSDEPRITVRPFKSVSEIEWGI